jgi:hypothetical protein
MAKSTYIARIKKAELLSSIGAGVLGAGIALLLANHCAYAIPILLLVSFHAAACSRNRLSGRVRSLARVGFVLVLLVGIGCVVALHRRPPILK